MILYHLLWTLILIFCLPWAVLSGDRRFRARFALAVPRTPPGDSPVWIHALSVGEVYSALPLVEKIRRDCPGLPVFFTSTTRKGMAVAERIISAHVDALCYMPVDAWWCAERMLNRVNPAVFVLVESDIWPCILDRAGKRGIKRLLVNGRVSPRTFRGYRMFPFAARRLFQGFDLCLMQSETDMRRVVEVGVDAARVEVGGNIKFDRSIEPMGRHERSGWLNLFGFNATDPVVVAGSTHPGEEEILIGAFFALRKKSTFARLIIAPRNTERAAEILETAARANLDAILKSRFPAKVVPDVVVVDTIGELGRLYGLATVAFVGGSLVPVGGHNPLEPAGHGCPVLFGPGMHNFVEMARMLEEAGAGFCVADESELSGALVKFVLDKVLRNETGKKALRFVEDNKGAVDRSVRQVKTMIAKRDMEDKGR
jgi:3-deoxy-D-manno-octulosonic-acid transferase